MQLKKFIISLILIILVTAGMISASASDEREQRDWTGWVTEDNQLSDNAIKTAGSAIIVDINSGRIVYQKRAYNTKYPASTTKVMTCMLALENGNLEDMVTVSDEMWSYISKLDTQSTMIHVRRGETMSLKDLLYGLMMESGNDAAVVIAIHIGGTYDHFIEMMNAKAAEIGMISTHYVNPHGLPDETHLTTARDMALLTMYAKENYPFFNIIVATESYKPADTNTTSYSELGISYTNSNKLILQGNTFFYEYATGVKTGYTKAAQGVLVSSAEYGNQSLVAIIMDDKQDNKWPDSITLFDYALDFYDTIKLSELFADKQFTAEVEGANMNTTGNQLNITIGQGEEVFLTESVSMIEEIINAPNVYFTETVTYNTDVLTAPINMGDEIGTVTYKYNYSHNTDDYLAYKADEGDIQYFEYTAPLYAAGKIYAAIVTTPTPAPTAAATEPPEDKRLDLDLWQVALIAIGVLFVVLIILLIILAANKGGPNRRYPDNGGRHSYEERGSSRRRY